MANDDVTVGISIYSMGVLLRIANFNNTLFVKTMQTLHMILKVMVNNPCVGNDPRIISAEAYEKFENHIFMQAAGMGIDTNSQEFYEEVVHWYKMVVPVIISVTYSNAKRQG